MKKLITLCLFISGCTIITSTPQPTPTPSVSPTPSVLPSPSTPASPTPTPSSSSSPVATGTVWYSTQNVLTTSPSFTGARVGAYADVLVPSASGSIADNLPTPKGFPFYAEINFDSISRAYNLADEGATMAQRSKIYLQALALLKSFGVQPIKQSIGVQPTDWDHNSEYGVSYRQIVLTGNIYPPCVAGPQPGVLPNVQFLKMIEAGLKSGVVPKGAFIYLYDEPNINQHADLIAQAKVVRANAPSLLIMVTMKPSADVAGLVDIYSPIDEDWVNSAPQLMGYGSCSAQGSCTNGIQHAPTGTPMMVLDADPVNWVAYPVVFAGIGAKSALYYNTVEQLSLAPGGQYKFGGNGDGTLLYAGTNFTVWPSLRLLYIKQGLAKLEALRALPDGGKAQLATLVQDSKHWSHNLADYLR